MPSAPSNGLTLCYEIFGKERDPAQIPGAELLVVPGMGHDIPLEVEDQVVEAIVANTRRAAAAPTA